MDQKLTVGELLSGAGETLAENRRATIIFVATLTTFEFVLRSSLMPLSTAFQSRVGGVQTVLNLVGLGTGLIGIIVAVAVAFGQYLLWESMLRNRGYLPPAYRKKLAPYFGLIILGGLAILLGYVFLIVPGLIATARWRMAPAYLLAEDCGISDSLGRSWDDTRGSTTPIVLTNLMLMGVGLAAAFAFGASVAASHYQVAAPMRLLLELISRTVSAFEIAMGVFLFGRLHGGSRTLAGVFE